MTWRIYDVFVGDKVPGTNRRNPWMTWSFTDLADGRPLGFDDTYQLKFDRETRIWYAMHYSQNNNPRWRDMPRLLPEFLALIGEEEQAKALALAIEYHNGT